MPFCTTGMRRTRTKRCSSWGIPFVVDSAEFVFRRGGRGKNCGCGGGSGGAWTTYSFVVGTCDILPWRIFRCDVVVGGSGRQRVPLVFYDSCYCQKRNKTLLLRRVQQCQFQHERTMTVPRIYKVWRHERRLPDRKSERRLNANSANIMTATVEEEAYSKDEHNDACL